MRAPVVALYFLSPPPTVVYFRPLQHLSSNVPSSPRKTRNRFLKMEAILLESGISSFWAAAEGSFHVTLHGEQQPDAFSLPSPLRCHRPLFGLFPSRAIRPALPMTRLLWSTLETRPTVAMHVSEPDGESKWRECTMLRA